MNTADLSGLPPGVTDHLQAQGIEELYPPQTEAVDAGVTDGENVVASVPTASGKTLIAELAMLSAINRGGKALYIVPLRALASEKKAEFEEFEEYGISVGVSTGNYESDGEWLSTKDVIVATSEKVDSLVRNGAAWIEDLSCVVADEVHLIDDAQRGPTLEVTLAKLRQLNPDLQTVALSATVGNAADVAEWLDAELVDSTWRPIDLKKGVHYGNALHLDDGTQTELEVRSGEKQTAAVVRDTLEDDGSTLVFVNSRRNAEAAARRLSDTVEPHLTGEEREELADVADEIRDVSDTETSEDLADAVEGGAAFHHAGLCVTGDTQILSADGTFAAIEDLVGNEPDDVIGMSEHDLETVGVTDTFKMGERPVLNIRTRTGNQLRLSENHPLPTITENGIEWIRAGDIEPEDYIARPRRIDIDVESPSFRELIPDDHRVFREYETVKRIASRLETESRPSTYHERHKWDRNITVGAFRSLCEATDKNAKELYDHVICDGGQKPVRVPDSINSDFCWLAGAVAGDGYLRDNSVVLTGRSKLLLEFHKIAIEQFDREPGRYESPSGTPYEQLRSTVVSDVLAKYFGMPRNGDDELHLPEIPLEDELLGAYLSGLFDADGTVSPRRNTEGSPCVEFYSTSETLITQIKTALLRFGIIAFQDERNVEGKITEHDSRKIRSHQNVYRLTIYGTTQLRRFEQQVGSRHSEKSEKLRMAIEQNPDGGRGQNDVIPAEIGTRVREIRKKREISMSDLEPAVPKATLSRFETRKTPMKRSTFQALAEQLDDELLYSLAKSGLFWDRVEAVEDQGKEPLYDLSTESANFVANGIIAHNTSDHRSLVEDAFRDRLLKVISATPTLAAGVNTPSRRVVVRDWRRYDGTAGGMQPLDVLEVHQMMGRAGRPGMDPYGEAVLIASSHDELDELFDRYVYADPEPVRSKLAAEPALRTHVLATIATGFAGSREELLSFLERTLYASQSAEPGRLERVTDDVLEYLERNEFVEREPAGSDGRDGDTLTATNLGHTVSRLYLDPMSAAEIVDGLRAVEGRPTALGLYHLVSRTPDMYELYLRSGDHEEYMKLCYEREEELLGPTPSEFEEGRFEDWLAALKTAKLLEDWAGEVDEDRITETYGIGPGDIRGKVDTAEWLLNAAEQLANELDVGEETAIREARKRVEYGVGEELLDLAGVRGVGRKRARRLYDAGIETRSELREADKSVVLSALRGRRKTAENVLDNAGREDPSMEDVDEAEGEVVASTDGGGADERDGRDETADESAANESDDSGQASLGDF